VSPRCGRLTAMANIQTGSYMHSRPPNGKALNQARQAVSRDHQRAYLLAIKMPTRVWWAATAPLGHLSQGPFDHIGIARRQGHMHWSDPEHRLDRKPIKGCLSGRAFCADAAKSS